MTREGLEKYHSDAAWRAAYEAHLAKASGNGAPDADAIAYAETAADIALAEAEGAEAEQKAAVAAARARLTARDAEERAEAEAKPDPAQAALARAVAALNARRVVTHREGQDAAHGAADTTGSDGQEAGQSPAAKAVAKINATR